MSGDAGAPNQGIERVARLGDQRILREQMKTKAFSETCNAQFYKMREAIYEMPPQARYIVVFTYMLHDSIRYRGFQDFMRQKEPKV